MRSARSAVLVLLVACCVLGLAPVALAEETIVVTEVTTAFVPTDAPPAGPSVGDSFRFRADLLVDGAPAGTSAGRSVTIGQAPDGTLTGYIVERLHLPGGTVVAFGAYDQSALLAGVPQTIQAVGLDGDYRGRSGTLTNAPVQQGVATLTLTLH